MTIAESVNESAKKSFHSFNEVKLIKIAETINESAKIVLLLINGFKLIKIADSGMNLLGCCTNLLAGCKNLGGTNQSIPLCNTLSFFSSLNEVKTPSE